MAFAYSKMNVIDELKHYGNWTTMTVTDMLEALARVSEMVSMPTQDDLARLRVPDAFNYFKKIESDGGGEFTPCAGPDHVPRVRLLRARRAVVARTGARDVMVVRAAFTECALRCVTSTAYVSQSTGGACRLSWRRPRHDRWPRRSSASSSYSSAAWTAPVTAS